MASVREYAILYIRGTRTGGTVVGGGNAVLSTGQHALDGPEHTAATGTDRLLATTERSGLLPPLSGSSDDHLNGLGEWEPSTEDSMVPYYIPVDETFTVPLYKQALFSEAIEADGALVVNGLLLGVD